MYSADRWALIGEAGVFTDPFYSPGSDFIAIGNDIVAELIGRDRRGEDITHHAAFFSRMYLLLFQAFLKLYDGQYPIMGNAQVMTVKVAWDNACYWAISALLYFRRKYRDMAYMQQLEGLLTRFFFLHARMQAKLKQWSDADQASYGYQQMSLLDMPYLHRLQGQLWDDIDDATLTARLHENFADLERYAEVILQMAAGKTIDRDAGGFENAAVFQLPKVSRRRYRRAAASRSAASDVPVGSPHRQRRRECSGVATVSLEASPASVGVDLQVDSAMTAAVRRRAARGLRFACDTGRRAAVPSWPRLRRRRSPHCASRDLRAGLRSVAAHVCLRAGRLPVARASVHREAPR